MPTGTKAWAVPAVVDALPSVEKLKLVEKLGASERFAVSPMLWLERFVEFEMLPEKFEGLEALEAFEEAFEEALA